MSESLPCALCGFEGHQRVQVEMKLVEYAEPEVHDAGWKRWDHIPRCVDRVACRARVEAIPEPWPLNDGTPA